MVEGGDLGDGEVNGAVLAVDEVDADPRPRPRLRLALPGLLPAPRFGVFFAGTIDLVVGFCFPLTVSVSEGGGGGGGKGGW